MRHVIVHYHLFKNAGSSIDRILQQALGERWSTFDPEPDKLVDARALADTIVARPNTLAFSSHMIVPPLPAIEGTVVHPIVVLRDPILRLRSAWLFEWQKQKGTKEPVGSLADYVRSKFERRRGNAVESFQTIRLSVDDAARTRAAPGTADADMLGAAKRFLRSLPVFGLVERFDESLAQFERAYGPRFPGLRFPPVRVNVMQAADLTVQERYERIEHELGPSLYAEFIARNQMDIALYHYAEGLFDRLGGDPSVTATLGRDAAGDTPRRAA